MARPKKEEVIETNEKENKEKEVASATSIVSNYMRQKENIKDHYNFEKDVQYKISTGSLIFDSIIGSGVPNCCLRATGGAGNGKSSFVLTLTKNFLDTVKNSRAIYARSEGRLSEYVRNRSGVKFVSNPDDWVDGTCLILDSNVYEFIFGLFRKLIIENAENKRYYFIIDSADTLCRRDDLDKPFEEAHMAPGGAMLTSIFFKKVGLAMAKRGHTMIFISQKRDVVKIDPRQKVPEKQGSASGANALKHQADWVFEFLNRTEFEKDFIRENPSDDKSKIIGHWCKIKIVKSDNETNETIVRYPIRYKCINGTSVWLEYELADFLLMWGMAKKAGAGWITLSEDIMGELKPLDVNVPEKIQGIDNLRKYLEEHPNVTKYLFNKFKTTLIGN